MKLQHKITAATIALASLTLVPSKVHATTGLAGDLVLAFQDSNGNILTNLEVDLGLTTQFTATASFNLTAGSLSGGVTGTGGLNVNDLITAYGSNWNTLTDTAFTGATNLTWSVDGLNGTNTTAAQARVYVTQPGVGQEQTGTLLSQLGNAATPIKAFETGFTFGSGSAVGTSSGIQPSGGLTSYTTELGSPDWAIFNTSVQNNVSSSGNITAELYDYNGTGVAGSKIIDVGTFTLTPAGGLSFRGSSVPEPTTFGLLGMAALGMVGLRRRRANA